VWKQGKAWIDPFRPHVEPGGFLSLDALQADREKHLAAVRTVFTDTDVLVFTLGLTEAWCSKRDGAVFGAAPGVAGGSFNLDLHEFVNFRANEVIDDLHGFIRRFRSVNPSGLILLTVSPVPLIATYEDRHVLVSTVASKSVLRVAADEIAARYPYVEYFPSYEIVMAPGNSHYFEDDLRGIREIGVAHVMRVFTRHYVHAGVAHTRESFARAEARHHLSNETRALAAVMCDEEEIVRSVRS
jgi:hypothetical protein